MDLLIKYRNDRKREGASAGELNGLDGRIHALLDKSVDQVEETLDVELLRYRKSLAEAGMNCVRIDKHIFHVLGSRPANIVDVIVCTIGETKKEVPVAVDLANETVGDLLQKAGSVVGVDWVGRIRLIHNGKRLENTHEPLSRTRLQAGNRVFVCYKLGCTGNCCERSQPLQELLALLKQKAGMAGKAEEAEEEKICAMLSDKEVLCMPFIYSGSPTMRTTPINTITQEPVPSSGTFLPESDEEDLYG